MSASDNKKKILVINGSPKKEASTTMSVTRAFVSGIEAARECETEYLNISDLNIKPCLGCLSCWGRTPGECVIKDDDIPVMRKKVAEADYIIESYPLYFFGMPGTMKIYTDRMLGMMGTYIGQESPKTGDSFHKFRYDQTGKKFIVISGCAFTEADDVYEALEKQYDMICGKERWTGIFCPQIQTLAKMGGSARLSRYLKKFEAAGNRMAEDGFLSAETLADLRKPPFTHPTYTVLLDQFWQNQKNS